MRGVAEREEGWWRRVSWWRRGLENKPFAQQNVVNCLCMGSLVGQLAPVAAGMVSLRRCNTSAWHDRRLLGFAGRCLLFQRGRVGFLNDHPKLRGPTQQIVSPPAGHGRFHELQCCGALLDCAPIAHVPLHDSDVRAMEQAPLHVRMQPLLHVLWRVLPPAPRRCLARLNLPMSGATNELVITTEISKPFSTAAGVCHGLRHVSHKVSTARRCGLLCGWRSRSSGGCSH